MAEVGGLGAALIYRTRDGEQVTLGIVTDPSVVEHVQTAVITRSRVVAQILSQRDPVLAAIEETRALRVERVVKAIEAAETEDTADGADGPLADSIPPSAPRPTRSGCRFLRAVQDTPAKGGQD